MSIIDIAVTGGSTELLAVFLIGILCGIKLIIAFDKRYRDRQPIRIECDRKKKRGRQNSD